MLPFIRPVGNVDRVVRWKIGFAGTIKQLARKTGLRPLDLGFRTPLMSSYRSLSLGYRTPPMSDYRPVDHTFHTPPMSDYRP
ncbi:MAG TPA: hypothetical protein VN364_07965 [Bellilinea sp.]|nr:hypothetical protein [Bellilinea sp.]